MKIGEQLGKTLERDLFFDEMGIYYSLEKQITDEVFTCIYASVAQFESIHGRQLILVNGELRSLSGKI